MHYFYVFQQPYGKGAFILGQVHDILLLLKYILLGVFQGVTEPLPISSSGHLILLENMLGIHLPGLSFEVVVHFGSLIAICIVYRNSIVRLIQHSFRYLQTKDRTYYADFSFVLLLVIATIPAGIIGVLFEDYISHTFSMLAVIGVTLIITGIFLWMIRNRIGTKGEEHISIVDAIIIGCAQALALIPGISRSGATIVAALLVGVNRETALRFSFLLYIPVGVGSIVFSINDLVQDPLIHGLAVPFMIAFISSIIATFFALKWFMNIMKEGKLKYFAGYCFIIGTIILIFI